MTSATFRVLSDPKLVQSRVEDQERGISWWKGVRCFTRMLRRAIDFGHSLDEKAI